MTAPAHAEWCPVNCPGGCDDCLEQLGCTCCVENGHTLVMESFRCVTCGQEERPEVQMTFADLVEMEPTPGDPSYTRWLEAGRPRVDTTPTDVRA